MSQNTHELDQLKLKDKTQTPNQFKIKSYRGSLLDPKKLEEQPKPLEFGKVFSPVLSQANRPHLTKNPDINQVGSRTIAAQPFFRPNRAKSVKPGRHKSNVFVSPQSHRNQVPYQGNFFGTSQKPAKQMRINQESLKNQSHTLGQNRNGQNHSAQIVQHKLKLNNPSVESIGASNKSPDPSYPSHIDLKNQSSLETIQNYNFKNNGVQTTSKRPKTSVNKRGLKLLNIDKQFEQSIQNNMAEMGQRTLTSHKLLQDHSSQAKLKPRTIRIKSIQRQNTFQRKRPEETVSFVDQKASTLLLKEHKRGSIERLLSNEESKLPLQDDNNSRQKRQQNSILLDQINSYITKDKIETDMTQKSLQNPNSLFSPSSLTQNNKSSMTQAQRDIQSNGTQRTVFENKNIGIKSKPRIVDATFKAYKVLENAFINQAGNPNDLEKQFNSKNINEESIYKEMFGSAPRTTKNAQSKLLVKQSQINFQSDETQNKSVNALKSVTPISNMDTCPSGLNQSKAASNQQKYTDLQSQGKLSAANSTVLQQKYLSARQCNEQQQEQMHQAIRNNASVENQLNNSQAQIMPKKTIKIRRNTKRSNTRGGKSSLRRKRISDAEINNAERLYLMLETVTKEREHQLQQMRNEQQARENGLLPMFSSNHIQNLTINAQPGFNIGQLTQLTNDPNTNLQYQIQAAYNQQMQQQAAFNSQIQQQQMDMFNMNQELTDKYSSNKRKAEATQANNNGPRNESKSRSPKKKQEKKPKNGAKNDSKQHDKTTHRFENDIHSSDLPRNKSINTNSNLSKQSQKSAQTVNSNRKLNSGSDSSIIGYKFKQKGKARDLSPEYDGLNSFLQPPKRGLTLDEKKQRKLKEIKNKMDGYFRNKTLKAQGYKQTASQKSMEDSISFSSSNLSNMSKKPKVLVDKLTKQQTLKKKLTLIKKETMKKRTKTLEVNQVKAKFTHHNIVQSGKQIPIDGSLKISQNMSNSQRVGDMIPNEGEKKENDSDQQIIKALREKILMMSNIDQTQSQQANQDLKGIMMKVIQDMSEQDLQALVTQKVSMINQTANDLQSPTLNPFGDSAVELHKNPMQSPDTKADTKDKPRPKLSTNSFKEAYFSQERGKEQDTGPFVKLKEIKSDQKSQSPLPDQLVDHSSKSDTSKSRNSFSDFQEATKVIPPKKILSKKVSESHSTIAGPKKEEKDIIVSLIEDQPNSQSLTDIQLSKIDEQNVLQEESISKSKSKRLSGNQSIAKDGISPETKRTLISLNKSSISSLKEGSGNYDSPKVIDPSQSSILVGKQIQNLTQGNSHLKLPIAQVTMPIEIVQDDSFQRKKVSTKEIADKQILKELSTSSKNLKSSQEEQSSKSISLESFRKKDPKQPQSSVQVTKKLQLEPSKKKAAMKRTQSSDIYSLQFSKFFQLIQKGTRILNESNSSHQRKTYSFSPSPDREPPVGVSNQNSEQKLQRFKEIRVKEKPVEKFIHYITQHELQTNNFQKGPKLSFSTAQGFFSQMDEFENLPQGQKMASSHFDLQHEKEQAREKTPDKSNGGSNLTPSQGLVIGGDLQKMSIKNAFENQREKKDQVKLMIRQISKAVNVQIKANVMHDELMKEEKNQLKSVIDQEVVSKHHIYENFKDKQQYSFLLSKTSKNTVSKGLREFIIQERTREYLNRALNMERLKMQMLKDQQRNYLIYLDQLDIHNNERLKIQLEEEREFQNRQKLHDSYLVALLNEVEHNSFNKVKQERLKIVTNFTNTELKNKLIQSYDINIKKVIYPNLKKRFVKAKAFIDENLRFEEEDKSFLKQQSEKFRAKKWMQMSALGHQDGTLNILEKKIYTDFGRVKYIHLCKDLENLHEITNLFTISFKHLKHLQEDLIISKTNLDSEIKEFKNSLEVKRMQIERRQKDQEQIDDQNKFTDLVWAEKNNQKSLIRLQDTQVLDRALLSKHCLFTLKQNLNNMSLLNQLDWDKYEVDNMRTNKRFRAQVKDTAFWYKINSVVKSNFNVQNDEFNIGYMIQSHRAINWQYFWISHQRIKEDIEKNYKDLQEKKAPPPICFYLIATSLPKYVCDHIFDEYFLNRYQKTYESFKFHSKCLEFESIQNHTCDKAHQENIAYPFFMHNTFHEISKSHIFHQILFKHRFTTIYEKLYDIEQDFELFNLLGQLIYFQKSMFMTKYKILKNKQSSHDLTENDRANLEQMEYTYFQLKLQNKMESYKAAFDNNTFWEDPDSESVISDNVKSSHSSIEKGTDSENSKFFANIYNGPTDVTRIQEQFNRVTALATQKEKFKQVKLRFKRTNAHNKFNFDTVEFNILENIDKHELRVKDKVSMYYKRIENYILDEEDAFQLKLDYHTNNGTLKLLQNQINQTDSDSRAPSDEEDPRIKMNDLESLQFKFGYKSVLIRDEHDKFLFEIYTPIEMKKGERRIKDYQISLRAPQSFQEFKQRELGKQTKRIKKSKVTAAILPREFETDDSMRQLDKSDLDQDSADENLKKQARMDSQMSERSSLDLWQQRKEDKYRKVEMKTKLGEKNEKLNQVFGNQKNLTPLEHYNKLRKDKDRVIKANSSSRKLFLEDKKCAKVRDQALLSKVMTKEQDLYQVFNPEDGGIDKANHIWKTITEKVKIDGLINQVEVNVHVDNQRQLKKLVKIREDTVGQLKSKYGVEATPEKPAPVGNPTPHFKNLSDNDKKFDKSSQSSESHTFRSDSSNGKSNKKDKTATVDVLKNQQSRTLTLNVQDVEEEHEQSSPSKSSQKQSVDPASYGSRASIFNTASIRKRILSKGENLTLPEKIQQKLELNLVDKIQRQIQQMESNQKIFDLNLITPEHSSNAYAKQLKAEKSFKQVKFISKRESKSVVEELPQDETHKKKTTMNTDNLPMNIEIISNNNSEDIAQKPSTPEQIKESDCGEEESEEGQGLKRSKTNLLRMQIQQKINLSGNAGLQRTKTQQKGQFRRGISLQKREPLASRERLLIQQKIKSQLKRSVTTQIESDKQKIESLFQKAFNVGLGMRITSGDLSDPSQSPKPISPLKIGEQRSASAKDITQLLNKNIEDKESEFNLENEIKNIEKIRKQKQLFKKQQERIIKKRQMIFDFKIRQDTRKTGSLQSTKRSMTQEQLNVISQIGKQYERRNKLIKAKDNDNFEKMNKVRETKDLVCSKMFKSHRNHSELADSNSMLKLLGGIIIQKVNDQKVEKPQEENTNEKDNKSQKHSNQPDPEDQSNLQNAQQMKLQGTSFAKVLKLINARSQSPAMKSSILQSINSIKQQQKTNQSYKKADEAASLKTNLKYEDKNQEITGNQIQVLVTRMKQAIEHKNTGLMEDILKRYQFKIENIKDEVGNNLLIMATMKGDYKMCDILIQQGINVNMQNNLGNTALHYAIMMRFTKTIDLLISYGANENLENNDGKRPWQMC